MPEVLTNIQLATLASATPGEVDANTGGLQPYGLLADAAVAIDNGLVHWCGPAAKIPEACANWTARDLGGRLVTPGLVDCHTHIVYGGSRAREFEMRLEGASYEEIARAGGGIVSTVGATRGADVEELVLLALPRVDALIAEGVTTLEIKSGYGLDIDSEITMLRAAREIGRRRPVRVVTTWLAAHVIGPEYKDRPDDYIRDVCIAGLHAAHGEGLVDAVDGFCEGIAFSVAELEPLFVAAAELGLPVKLHAEQLSNIGGTAFAARHEAISADHIEYATDADVGAMADADTVAVLLPGAFYFLRETKMPPIEALRDRGVAMALATDANPGSSPLTSLLLTLNMGCTLFRLTPEEALAGITRNGAKALGLADCGQIAPGLRADLCVWDVEHPAELAYRIGFNPLYERLYAG